MKSKFLKSIVVIAIGAALIGGLFIAKNRKGAAPQEQGKPESAQSGQDGAPVAGGVAQGSGQKSAGSESGASGSASDSSKPGESAKKDGGVPVAGVAPTELEKGATEQKAPECFQVTYTTRDLEDRIKNNNFAFQKNLLKLPEVAFNPSTVCVRVDGKPVRFEAQKGKPTEIVISPLKNIKSVVTASYCLGDSKCNESCKAPAEQQEVVVKPKDEFLEAIGGDSDSDLAKEYGKWDTEDGNAHNEKLEAALDPEIRRELAALDEEESKPKKAARKLETFSGWDRSDESPACRNTGASQKAARDSKKEKSS